MHALLLYTTAIGLTSAALLHHRQAFDPDETTGRGSNCIEAFGPGYVECVPASDSAPRLCVNPEQGEKCCNNLWGCPASSFCLVQDLCCPDGLSPETCAAQNDVTLPPGFVPPSGNSTTPDAAVPDVVVEDGPEITKAPVAGSVDVAKGDALTSPLGQPQPGRRGASGATGQVARWT
ncbi:hypothetical protein B0T18DRAFT_428166 [Schizothecium vesticola]|uniref:Uncharacterized protein n=1 Tax=Schizothecium vesticola TaxID=314040 RepID=A0AA40F2S4_9PEZI|nr:hypothetical protein B0T18DRAFT_428166 [Schizothecium vesticola]